MLLEARRNIQATTKKIHDSQVPGDGCESNAAVHKRRTEWCARTGKEYSVSIGTFVSTAAAKPLKSKIQTFCAGFWGFWDFGSLCSNSSCEAPSGPNLGFWGWILDFGF